MPFTVDQFLQVFREYNDAVFPAQILLNVLAVVAVVAACRGGRGYSRVVAAILSVLWLWTGVVYHLLFFTRINKVAYSFAALCAVQAFVFFFAGVVRGEMLFRFRLDKFGIAASSFLFYALAVYPLLGYVLGHSYPASPTFGAPCPTTIFTFGVLLLTRGRLHFYVYVIPFVWSLIGATAAFLLGVPEDLGLLAAGIVGTLLLIRKPA